MRKRAIAADQSRFDDYGTRIMVDGMDMSRFEANPVLCYIHDGYAMPIGRATEVGKLNGQLTFVPEFDLKDPFAAEVARKYDEGFMKGWSVRIAPLEKTSDSQHMLPNQPGPTILRSELYEISAVPIPSLANALTLERSSMTGKTVSHTTPQPPNTMKTLCRAFGLPESAGEAELTEKAIALTAELSEARASRAATEAEKATLEAEKAALEARITQIEDAAKAERTESLIGGAIAQGKITAAEKETYARLANADYEAVKTLLDGKKAYQPLRQMTGGGVPGTADARAAWTMEDWQKKDPKGLAEMRANDPERFSGLKNTLRRGA